MAFFFFFFRDEINLKNSIDGMLIVCIQEGDKKKKLDYSIIPQISLLFGLYISRNVLLCFVPVPVFLI